GLYYYTWDGWLVCPKKQGMCLPSRTCQWRKVRDCPCPTVCLMRGSTMPALISHLPPASVGDECWHGAIVQCACRC
ncbi:MAG: hypothetical protein SPJ13_05785, partial [Bacteroidales bacterium]|nr:hypothetical protein [Bacteroidales bacterium]